MKKSRFSEEQIVGVLKETEAGVPVAKLCRRLGRREKDAGAPAPALQRRSPRTRSEGRDSEARFCVKVFCAKRGSFSLS